MVKKSLEKQPMSERHTTPRNWEPTSLEKNPINGEHSRRIFILIAARVQGIQRLNWLHLTEQNNLAEGTNKNTYEVWERSNPK